MHSFFVVMLEGIDSGIRVGGHRQGPSVRHKFSGFMLAVERKSNESNVMTEVNAVNMISHSSKNIR